MLTFETDQIQGGAAIVAKLVVRPQSYGEGDAELIMCAALGTSVRNGAAPGVDHGCAAFLEREGVHDRARYWQAHRAFPPSSRPGACRS